MTRELNLWCDIQEVDYITDKHKILAIGSYKGKEFVIVYTGIHPCAYVRSDINYRNCEDKNPAHYGFTYYGNLSFWNKHLDNEEHKNLLAKLFVGWDYGHCDDYESYYAGTEMEKGKIKHTTEEILQNVLDVIDWMLEIEGIEK